MSERTQRFGRHLVSVSICLSVTPIGYGAAGSELLRVKVKDHAGQTVPRAEAFLLDTTNGLPITRVWTSADKGLIAIDTGNISRYFEGETIPREVELLVRAAGHAWSVRRVELPLTEPLTITLGPSREIILRINSSDRRTLPDDLEPIVYTGPIGTATWNTCVQSYLTRRAEPETAVIVSPVKRRAGGEFIVRVPTDLESFHILIDHPGFLRCFAHGPIRPGDLADGIARIELPRPIRVAVYVGPKENAPTDYAACGVEVTHSPSMPEGWSFRVESRYHDGRAYRTVFDDLTPGTYNFAAFTGNKQTRRDSTRNGFCVVTQGTKLAAGDSSELKMELETYDDDYWQKKLKGDYDVTLDIDLADGSPARGKPFKAEYNIPYLRKQIELAAGTLPEDGLVHLRNVAPGSAARGVTIVVTVDENFMGQIYLRGEEKSQTFKYALAPASSDVAPDFEMIDIKSRTTLRLSDLRGQVVLLEFWASWCGPCQEPMRHNNDLMKRRRDSWRDRVTVLGVSIDDKIETIIDHVNQRDWYAVRQVHIPGAWKSDPVKHYSVTGVPSAFLIDAKGIVVWAGHPTSIDIEKEIEELLAK